MRSVEELKKQLLQNIKLLKASYDGEKNPKDIQLLKGMLREFEEELVWAHFGVPVKNIEHLRLGFYSGDIFTEEPNKHRDVEPILEMLRRINPTIISVAFDPEGSGPDTHYKVLQAIAEAIRRWGQEQDISKLKVIGYRNVWYRFHPAEANVFLPVSLNSLAILENAFKDCYISQVHASFPSPHYDGPFSEMSQHIWSQQFKDVQLITGKTYFYENENLKVRATHGMIFYKEMPVNEFLTHARKLEKSMEGSL
jgi:glucosamine-6-phosphate deaminase